MKKLYTLLTRFEDDERGSAMTEFVMFMPIWVTLFIGIFALGKAGITTTATPIRAQKQLWTNVIGANDTVHWTPRAAGPDAAAKVGGASRTPQSLNSVANGFDAATWAALGLTVRGTIGESYQRTVVLGALADEIDPKLDPEDVIGDRTYPMNTLNDAIQAPRNTSTIGGLLASVVNASGGVHALAAGIRYGVVTGEVSGEQIQLAGGASITSNAAYDILVAPMAITNMNEAEMVPYSMARLMAESDEKYEVMLNFGESEWTDGPSGNYEQPNIEDEGREQGENESENLDPEGFANEDDYQDCLADPNCGSAEDYYPPPPPPPDPGP